MLPMLAVRLELGTLLAADSTTLAPASLANKMQTIVAPFSLNENLTAGGLTFGTTNGLGPINCATGTQATGIDPVSRQQIITIIPGSGTGFRWLSAGGGGLPITVYGYALTDSTGATLLAAAALNSPIVINAGGQQIDVDPVQMTMVLNPLG